MELELDTFGLTAAILAVAGVVAFLAHRAKQPLIIAFILVGIIVGPSMLNWVDEVEPLQLFAKIGIAILLFLVGLKLDINLIRSIGKVALITGLGQVIFTTAIGFGIALLFGLEPIAALYVAVALTFSSTIIIVKLLSDKRELDELHGRIALGFLIVQDIVAIVAMITLTSFAGGGDAPVEEQFLRLVLSAGGIFLGLIIMMRWVLPWLLKRLAGSQELLIVSCVAWAVALAALTDVLGFSIEVGAFLAGFALASTRYRESIAASLSGLRDFLLLFFFIVLGAELDFSAIGDQIPAAIALSLFVLIGNPLIVLIIMGVMGYPSRVSFLAGLAVAQISEFSLIFIALGRDLDQVDDDVVGLVTLVGLITIAGSTYMILYSQQLYSWLEPALRIFERSATLPEPAFERARFDAIVFGYGRFGHQLVREIVESGCTVLVVEWDPYARIHVEQEHLADRVTVVFGDANSPDFPDTLPIRHARWIISTLPDADTNLVLAASLRRHGATCPIAVTVHTDDAESLYAAARDDGSISAVPAEREPAEPKPDQRQGCSLSRCRSAGHESANPGCKGSASTSAIGTQRRATLSASATIGANNRTTRTATVVYDQNPRSNRLSNSGSTASTGTLASSPASRTAASYADSCRLRAPPGSPHVPPWCDHSARCCNRMPASACHANNPAAPKSPQYRSPPGPSTHASPGSRTNPAGRGGGVRENGSYVMVSSG
jgi:Kef-type K+ transport system membrane component KefB